MIISHPHTSYVVKCDNCGYQSRSVADGFGTLLQAEVHAVRHDWIIEPCETDERGPDSHYCPECRANYLFLDS